MSTVTYSRSGHLVTVSLLTTNEDCDEARQQIIAALNALPGLAVRACSFQPCFLDVAIPGVPAPE